MDTQQVETTNEDIKIRRIVSLDFQRGLAIWLMVFLHAITHIYDFSWAYDLDQLLTKPIPVVIIIVLLAYLGGWAGYFLLISSTVNSLAMMKKASKAYSPKKILVKQLLTGFGVIIVGHITESFGYLGYFGLAIRTGNWSEIYPIWARIFMIETLHTIGWSIVIIGLVHYFLTIKEGYKHDMRNVLIYLSLAILVIIATPFIFSWIDSMPWAPLDTSTLPEGLLGYDTVNKEWDWPFPYVQAENASVKTYFLVILAGDLEPLFPYLATAFIGAAIGIALTSPKLRKKIPLAGGITAISFLLIGIILIIAGLPWDVSFRRPTIAYYFLLIGGQLGMMILLLWLVEFRGKPQRFGQNPIVKYFRLWGVIALSIYALQIYELFPRWIISLISGLDLVSGKNPLENEGLVILITIVIILFYDLLIRLWAKIDFKGSFEWLIVSLASIKQETKSKRLNVKKMMNEVEWISYKKEKEE